MPPRMIRSTDVAITSPSTLRPEFPDEMIENFAQPISWLKEGDDRITAGQRIRKEPVLQFQIRTFFEYSI